MFIFWKVKTLVEGAAVNRPEIDATRIHDTFSDDFFEISVFFENADFFRMKWEFMDVNSEIIHYFTNLVVVQSRLPEFDTRFDPWGHARTQLGLGVQLNQHKEIRLHLTQGT